MTKYNKDTIARMKKALAQGRMVYNTGRTAGRGNHPVYEQLSEDGRQLAGLKPLKEIIPNWYELLPTAAEAEVLRQKSFENKTIIKGEKTYG